MTDTPTLTDVQREALAHAIHEAVCCDDPEEVVVSGFREAADDLAPFIARMVADAEQRGRVAQLTREERSDIAAVYGYECGYETGLEEGRAEVSAAVEAVLAPRRRIDALVRRSSIGVTGPTLIKEIDAALADPAAAVARIKAEALREAAEEAYERGDIGKDGGVEAWDWLAYRADRIGGESDG